MERRVKGEWGFEGRLTLFGRPIGDVTEPACGKARREADGIVQDSSQGNGEEQNARDSPGVEFTGLQNARGGGLLGGESHRRHQGLDLNGRQQGREGKDG